MVQECLQRAAVELLQIIAMPLGMDGAANYLASIAALLGIAVALSELGFAGRWGRSMIRAIVILAFAVWLGYSVNAKHVHLERPFSEAKQCLRELLPPFILIPVSGLHGEQ